MFFFKCSLNAKNKITDLFDFVWPTATAMWNLRWQVTGFVQAIPDATREQLIARFCEGSDIRSANIKRACIEHSWEKQKSTFAQVVLVNAIATYEAWADDILDELGKRSKRLQEALQRSDGVSGELGVNGAIAELTLVESPILKANFYPVLSSQKHFSKPHIAALMKCYRYFKELRNAGMHRGGLVDSRLLQAYGNFLAVATPAQLGLSVIPDHSSLALGQPINLSLRGVVGFSHVIQKMITTIDAEFSVSESAERSFIKRWKEAHQHQQMMPANSGDRRDRIRRMTTNAGFSIPADIDGLAVFLKRSNLISF